MKLYIFIKYAAFLQINRITATQQHLIENDANCNYRMLYFEAINSQGYVQQMATNWNVVIKKMTYQSRKIRVIF